jgi:hypothetical protein
VLKVDGSGALDAGFSGDGIAQPSIGTTGYASAIAIQDDGYLALAGEATITGNVQSVFARLDTSGALDPSFDYGVADGSGIKVVPGNGIDFFHGLHFGPDGDLIAAGIDNASVSDSVRFVRLDGPSIADYFDTVTDWDTGLAGTFGACLLSVANGAASWNDAVACNSTDGAEWNAIPTTPQKVAFTTVPGEQNGGVDIRFGVRVPVNQVAGSHYAPITFEVLAPNV